MAAGATYTPIATTTLGSSSTSVSFSSFSGYTDLVCIYSVRTSAAGAQDVYVQFNGDTATNYSATILYGDGSAASSYRSSNDARGILLDFQGSAGPTSGPYNTGIINFMNYANSTTYKTTVGRTGRADSGADAGVGLWQSTAAITSMAFKLSAGNSFATGSVFTLYGITAA
jgi:hypothetical protein